MTRLMRYLLAAIGIAALALSYSIMTHAAVIVSVTHGPAVQSVAAKTATTGLPNPIAYINGFPYGGLGSYVAPFGNQQNAISDRGSGGDLMVLYPDGTARCLTCEAGFGTPIVGGPNAGFEGPNSIAVRSPSVSWDGTKLIFSMIVGAPAQYAAPSTYWQLYEATGLAEGQTVHITKVANQPANYNNIDPTYASDNGVVFVSDMPGSQNRNVYPQLDEYESQPTNTGIWKIDTTGFVWQMDDSPSGDFRPSVDGYGRFVYGRWDHLQQDQQCDTPAGILNNDCRDYPSETSTTPQAPVEEFPEPRLAVPGQNLSRHIFEHFQIWTFNQDGTSPETIDHLGPHELLTYFEKSFTNDPALVDFSPGNRTNRNPIENFQTPAVVPTRLGYYIGIDAPEFYTDTAGQIIGVQAPMGGHADTFTIDYLTPRAASIAYDPNATPPNPAPTTFDGRYRDPVILSDGTLIASYTPNATEDESGKVGVPFSQYNFVLVRLAIGADGYYHVAANLTPQTVKTIKFYNPNSVVAYTGPLFQIQPAEIVARPVPPMTTTALQPPELAAFAAANVVPQDLKNWMVQNDLGLFIARDVTSRDDADKQQPYDLTTPSGHTTIGNNGKLYTVAGIRIFQDDAVRSIAKFFPGRRKMARLLHDPASLANMPLVAGQPGTAPVASDGSVAFFVPARKAITWETVDAAGNPVVREREWIPTQPGEMRACDSCHGTNTLNQAGNPPPTNTPEALTQLVAYWKANNGNPQVCTNPQPDQTPICPDGSHQTGGTWSESAYPACVWTYVGGQCPATPPPAKLSVKIVQGTKVCILNALLPFSWLATPNPKYVPPGSKPPPVAPPPQFLLSITQGTNVCSLPATGVTTAVFK